MRVGNDRSDVLRLALVGFGGLGPPSAGSSELWPTPTGLVGLGPLTARFGGLGPFLTGSTGLGSPPIRSGGGLGAAHKVCTMIGFICGLWASNPILKST